MKRVGGAVLAVSGFVLVLVVGCGSPGRPGFSEGEKPPHAIEGNSDDETGATSSGIGAEKVVAKGFIGSDDDDLGSDADDDDDSIAGDDDDDSIAGDDDDSSSDPGQCECPDEPPPAGRCCPTGWTLMLADEASFDHNEDGLICGMSVSGEGNFPSGENRKDNTAPGTCALDPGYSQ